MSHRTKSFFDQDHRPKPRPHQWNHNRPALAETSANAVPVKPPIPATAEAKAKLQSFQFTAGTGPTVVGEKSAEGKENETAGHQQSRDEDGLDHQEPKEGSRGQHDISIGTSAAALNAALPSTPAPKLSIEDLIGNTEIVKKAQPQDQSPEEYIGWIPNSSSNLLTPNRLKRKRARSSSPSCPSTSQRADGLMPFGGPADGQVDKTTPEADPAADLWQRYGAKQATDGSRQPDFSHLMVQESPSMFETPLKASGLRRWASTGNEWPSCQSKRRRTNANPAIELWQSEDSKESGGKSKVAAMIEKIQESLHTQKLANAKPKPIEQVEGPSSSDPLPEIGAGDTLANAPPASPSLVKQAVEIQRAAPKHPLAACTSRAPIEDSGLDRGRAMVEVAKLQSTTDSSLPAHLHLQSKGPLPAYKRPSITRAPSGGGVQYPTRPQQNEVLVNELQKTTLPTPGSDSEDFGDDLDLTAEDLEELMDDPPALHQRSLYQIPQHPNPPPSMSMHSPPYNKGPNLPTLEEDDDDDEFGGNDIDEDMLAQAETQATQNLRKSPKKKSPSKPSKHHKIRHSQTNKRTVGSSQSSIAHPLQRYVIRHIADGEYTNDKGSRRPEKTLIGEDERTSKTTAITLRDSWTATPVAVGNIVHIADMRGSPGIDNAPANVPGQITVSDSEASPLIVVHPDHMLSATTIADSFDCIRKAVLQDRIKATSDTNKAMVYGKILHEIVQQSLSANQWSDAFLAELVDRTVLNHLEGLWELGMFDTVLAVEEIRAKMGELASWANIFVTAEPSDVSVVNDRRDEQIWMSISKLIAIEEHVWSPRWGLKGNIDATVQTTLKDHPKEPSKKLVMPFEVKTGRATNSPAHRAQTALYTLLLSDRYDFHVNAGILYYLENSEMSRIAPPAIEIRQMVQQRNRLASYIHRARHPRTPGDSENATPKTQEVEESGFPAMLKNAFKCGSCYARQSCFSYHALVENGSAESAGMIEDKKKDHGSVWRDAVGHLGLGAKHKSAGEALRKWFTKWDRLLTFEERDCSRMSKELWTMDSAEREKIGRCFGKLVISQDPSAATSMSSLGVVDGIQGSGGKINRFSYTFMRASQNSYDSFTDGTQLAVGEPVVVSSEQGQWALANGYIIALSKQRVTVAVDRKLGDARERLSDFNEHNNQILQGVMDVQVGEAGLFDGQSTILYRLDKDEFSNGLALVRNNLVTLMSTHPIHTKLRDQIILDAAPRFTLPRNTPHLPPTQIGQMNEDQQAAISKVLSADDYALILGMPGTGKTTTIAHLIRALLAQDQTILLTSFTHTAVDNILLKIRDIAPAGSILRLGVPAKIHPEVQTFCQLAATPRNSIEEIDEAFMKTKIVATTCMGTNHGLFNRRAFDICIVDEASQITLPTSLGPLLHARKFVLVGDHYQLPPLVQNKAALEGGLDVSLFRQLSEERSQAVAKLGEQYRMCEDIMSLSNTLIYEGQLRCGNESVASRTLRGTNMPALAKFHSSGASTCCADFSEPGSKCWLRRLTGPEHKVVFANTDKANQAALETLTSGKQITNVMEANLSAQLVLSLLAIGVPAKEIGVITLYRSQIALIRQLFKLADISSDVEIDSADRFQGRDKECIILSMVRSNEAGIVGDLLKDWRRVNVALTRARSKLIILGSRRTLRHNELLLKLLDLVDGKGWATDLPADAVESHAFNISPEVASSLAQMGSSPVKVPHDKAANSPLKAKSRAASSQAWKSSPPGVLQPSQNSANRGAAPIGEKRGKHAPKIVKGQIPSGGIKARKVMEQIAWEIFEDITADDL